MNDMSYMNNPIMDNVSTPEARGKRIRFVREHLLSLSREEFCLNTNINVQTLKGWELAWGGGLTRAGTEKIITRAKALKIYCTEAWLMHGIGRMATPITKELKTDESEESHIAKELLVFRELPHSIDTIVKDDGMLPLLYPGTYIGGIIVQNIEHAVDKDCIIIADDDECFVRILKQGNQPGHYNLVCLNEHSVFVKKEIKNITVKYAAPIVWIRKIFRELNDE